MIIPHSENNIKTFHLSNFLLSFLTIIFFSLLIVSAFFMVRQATAMKEIIRLSKYSVINKKNLIVYKKEIQRFNKSVTAINKSFNNFPEFSNDSLRKRLAIGGGELKLSEVNPEYLQNTSKIKKTDQNALLLKKDAGILKNGKELTGDINTFFQKRRVSLAGLPTTWPLKRGDGYLRVKPGKYKTAIFFSTPQTAVKATANGKVVSIAIDDRGLFKITIEHGFGFKTFYDGLVSVEVKQKQPIKKDDIIALSSGQLGYRIQIAGKWVNPRDFTTFKY